MRALGAGCTVIAAVALVWYRRTLREGKNYLEELAVRLGCEYEDWGLGFGRVNGVYQWHSVEVSVNKDYDARVQHRGLVVEPYSLDEATLVDRGLILYLPPSGADGIPQMTVDEMLASIEELVELADSLEG